MVQATDFFIDEVMDIHRGVEEPQEKWYEKLWLIVFDITVGLMLIFLLLRANPVNASSLFEGGEMTATQQAPMVAVLQPVDYQESSRGLVYDGLIQYEVQITNTADMTVTNLVVTASSLMDPLAVREPWLCDFTQCTWTIDELTAGESIAIPLVHGMVVAAVAVDNEDDAYRPVQVPDITITDGSGSVTAATGPTVPVQCRCLSVYTPIQTYKLFIPLGF